MGFFDGIKAEAQRNFIARADEAKDHIIYKYPENNIRLMTQLTVASDEMALFVKDGVVAGKLGPGRHTLDTNNVPFISKLLEKVTGILEVFNPNGSIDKRFHLSRYRFRGAPSAVGS